MDRTNNGLLAVHCDDKGIEAPSPESLKPDEDIPIPFFGGMEEIRDGLVEGVHERDKAVLFAEIGPVINDVLDVGQLHDTFGRLIEPMIFDLFDFEMAVAGKLRESSDRIALLDPKLEPGEFIAPFEIQAFPNESILAGSASKPLFVVGRKSIALDIARLAFWTSSFLGMLAPDYETGLIFDP